MIPVHAQQLKPQVREQHLWNHTHTHTHKLQALVYNILPSATAVFSYAIGPIKLSANEQFLLFYSSKFVTNNSNCIRHLFYN